MDLRIGIAKTHKYTADESGETIEVIERPLCGGYSVVLCDGMNSGCQAKAISSFVVTRIASLISEGVRDSTAIRATSDQLFTTYSGKTEAYLNTVSIDLNTGTFVVSRNSPCPVYYYQRGIIDSWNNACQPIGGSKHIQPSITEMPIEAGVLIILFSDGVFTAGQSYGQEIDIPTLIHSMMDDSNSATAQQIADFILNQAIRLDQEKPCQDMCVMVMQVTPSDSGVIRKVSYELPIQTNYY
jgi:serine phosphatase RsbU (regulator of sigma subunit)